MKKVTMKEANIIIADQTKVIRNDTVIDDMTGAVIAEIVPEEKLSVSKVVEKVLFLSARVSSKGNKIGISFLRYDTQNEKTGQIISNKEVPFISAWVDYSEGSKYDRLLEYPVLKELYVSISGNGNFVKLHNIFTDEEAAIFADLMA